MSANANTNVGSSSNDTSKELTEEECLADVVDQDEVQKRMEQQLGTSYTDKLDQPHKFWDEQPVLKLGEVVKATDNEPIDDPKTVDDIAAEPYPLKALFEWFEPDVSNKEDIDQLYKLLHDNYVEDDDSMFRFDYTREFLRWALTPPGFRKDWHCAVRVKRSGTMVGFISAIPATVRIYGKVKHIVEINFLCVHKKLRTKRLAPLLIKEITRRVNRQDIWQAVYTAGIVLPNPVVSCRYYHRSLNPKKLVDVRFSQLRPNMKMSMLQRLLKLPAKPLTPGVRPMVEKDVPAACALLADYLKKYHVAAQFNETDFQHWFLPRQGVIYTFVVENPKTSKITDLISFYQLPSSILNHPRHHTLNAAYSFYNVSTSTPMEKLLKDALILAKSRRFDVFNALDMFENEANFKELKFLPGDGHLQYYIYNW
eukprot:CAMPEP_0201552710 /NCGR_PEP_ID=MMETSP0173_2-20130828/16990_1 /ASSEMBLY_ACC=CAM_ASM_000268 /TAXON_ID=218659 /ORGANISM="Vexillifera sp., Strain DIVA3 564/2" /LENGTH=424 /DNA_ID=CAMNT_0047963233 /DNA_START=21 /DNA_END=1292 /DNA_ORIENTATION=+